MFRGSREFCWIRQHKRSEIIAQATAIGESKPVTHGLDALGFESVRAPALYDNGPFIVVDVVKDLQFAVARVHEDGTLQVYRKVDLDKYEAMRIADEFKEVLNEGLADYSST